MIGSVDRLTHDERGSSTVEFVLWLPIFIMILALITNAVFLFLEQSRMYTQAAQTTRAVSMDRETAAQAESTLQTKLGVNYTVDVQPKGGGLRGEEVHTSIKLPAQHAVIFGGNVVGALFAQGEIAVKVTKLREVSSSP